MGEALLYKAVPNDVLGNNKINLNIIYF